MSKENYEMQFLELMASLTAQTPDNAEAPPVEVKAEPQPEPKVEASVEELLGMTTPGVPKSAVMADLVTDEISHTAPDVQATIIEALVSPGGINVTAITDEGVTEEAVLISPAEEISEEGRENLIWQAITADVPGLGKTVTQATTSDLRRRLNRG